MKTIRRKIIKIKQPICKDNKIALLADKLHIQAHLALTEFRLRHSKNNIHNKKRTLVLDILHDYWRKGSFPQNQYKTKVNLRTPIFIDEQGTYCAVGYLMHMTGHTALAQKIDSDNKFILVEELQEPAVVAWLNEYGISKKEAVLIQPGYSSITKTILTEYTLVDKILDVFLIVICLVIVSSFIVASRIVNNREVSKEKKKTRIRGLKIATISVAGCFFTLFMLNEMLLRNHDQIHICFDGGFQPQVPGSVCMNYNKYGTESGWRERGGWYELFLRLKGE